MCCRGAFIEMLKTFLKNSVESSTRKPLKSQDFINSIEAYLDSGLECTRKLRQRFEYNFAWNVYFHCESATKINLFVTQWVVNYFFLLNIFKFEKCEMFNSSMHQVLDSFWQRLSALQVIWLDKILSCSLLWLFLVSPTFCKEYNVG